MVVAQRKAEVNGKNIAENCKQTTFNAIFLCFFVDFRFIYNNATDRNLFPVLSPFLLKGEENTSEVKKMKEKNDFSILKEEISQNNVLAMAELIAMSETRFLIGYMGNTMQKCTRICT